MRGLMISLVLATVSAHAAIASSVGEGYGESLLALTSARQAGSGGVALEDPWRQGQVVEATTALVSAGLQWWGLSVQGGAGPRLRLRFDGYAFTPTDVTGTKETADGSFGGSGGAVGMSEWGAHVTAQLAVVEAGPWRVAGLGRAIGLVQRMPDEQSSGAAVEVGVQAQRVMGSGRALTGWLLAGPVGRGAGRGFAGHVVAGVGLMRQVSEGLLGGAGGYAVGAEGEALTEGLMHGGLGGVYWVGRLGQVGKTLFLRGGLRSASGTSQAVRPHGGLGILWRMASGWGVQCDLAAAPLGALGLAPCATIGVRMP